MSDALDQACEVLWNHVSSDIPIHSTDRDRKDDGNYVRGHRTDIDTWTQCVANLTLRATREDWSTFNIAVDSSGIRRTLEVLLDDELLLRAVQEGATKQVKFVGADERYVGTDETPAQPWRIVHGNLVDWIRF